MSLLVHCIVPLPIPPMSVSDNQIPTCDLYQALTIDMDASIAFHTHIHHNNDNFSSSMIHLKPAPDGSFIISHQKHNSSANHTYFVIYVHDEYSYAMFATLKDPIRTQMRILINIRGTNSFRIIYIQINPYTRNILGRTYYQLYRTPGTQDLATHMKLPTYNIVKDITSRMTDTIHWAIILLCNVDTLEIYEEAIRYTAAE